MVTVNLYHPKKEQDWNELVELGKNTSFLFNRDFMEYHSERFEDSSLMIYERNKLVAILPANRVGKVVHSHQGLSYGGLVCRRDIKLNLMLECFRCILKFLDENGITKLFYKAIPRIYSDLPSDEQDWALIASQAHLYRRDSTIVINNTIPIPYQTRRKRSIKKAFRLNPTIKRDADFSGLEDFWVNILEPNLEARFGRKPVHSLEEIKLLAARFPNNIVHYNVYVDDKIMAGCTMFLNRLVAHAQYISGSIEGRKNGCLDFLFDHLIKTAYKDYQYFDFGNCNESEGQIINHGLLDWKEGFGGRAISHDYYEVETRNHVLLKDKISIEQ